jgi:hypothetical protein
MNDKRRSSGHSWLVPIIGVVLLSKAMRHGRRHRAWMHGAGADGDAATGFRLPPRIESTLNAWHARAHQAAEAAESPTA